MAISGLKTWWKGMTAAGRPPLSGRAGGLPGGGGFPLIGSGATAFVPQSYNAQVQELYLGNAIARSAVTLVSQAVGEAPIVAAGGMEDDRGGAAAARIADLLAAPTAGQPLMEVLAMHLLLHGNAYVQCAEDMTGALGALYALRPERITVEAAADGWPTAFAYRVGTQVTRFGAGEDGLPPELIAIRSAHPADDHYGLGALSAAAGAIAVHNAAARWNKALLDNAARPSGALTFDGGEAGRTLTQDQFDRLKHEIETAYVGAINAGRPMLLEGALKWQSLSLTPAEMDFAALRDTAAREIACAFGVPPMLLGLPGDATYANYREANRALWKNSVIPVANRILRAVAQGAAAWTGTAITLRVDENRVAALAEDRERLWTRVTAADFLTAAEKKALLGLD